MATGDLSGNVQRLVDHLHLVHYPLPVSARKLRDGDPSVLLPMLHFVLLDYSRHVALECAPFGLFGLTDAAFLSAAFRIGNARFGVKAPLTPAQMMARGFAERKLLYVTDVIRAVMARHEEAELAAQLSEKKVLPYARSHDLSSPTAQSHRAVNEQHYLVPPVAPVSHKSSVVPRPAHEYAELAPRSNVIRSSGAVTTNENEEIWQFLADAVSVGTGAANSLATRKAQSLREAQVSIPTLASALDATVVRHMPHADDTLRASLRKSTDIATDVMRLSTEFISGFPTLLPTPSVAHASPIIAAQPPTAPQRDGDTNHPTISHHITQHQCSNVKSAGSASPNLTPSRLPLHKRHVRVGLESSPHHPPKASTSLSMRGPTNGTEERKCETELNSMSRLVSTEDVDAVAADKTECDSVHQEVRAINAAEHEGTGGTVIAMTLAAEMDRITEKILDKLSQVETRLHALESKHQTASLAPQQPAAESGASGLRRSDRVASGIITETNIGDVQKQDTIAAVAKSRAAALHESIRDGTRYQVQSTFERMGLSTPSKATRDEGLGEETTPTPSATPLSQRVVEDDLSDAEYLAAMQRYRQKRASENVRDAKSSSLLTETLSSPATLADTNGWPSDVADLLTSLVSRGKETEALIARAKTQLQSV